MNPVNLTADDIATLEPMLELMSKQAHYKITLPYLLSRWSKFITEVEEGYQMSIYEYTNDLSTRNLLQKIVDQCPSLEVSRKLLETIIELDARFTKVTRKIEKNLINQTNEEIAWWWYHIPNILDPDLENDFRSANIL